MNAKLLGLFSGFPTRSFTTNIAERLYDELPVRDSLVFVSAWPSDYERNDCDATGMHGMFEEYNMSFNRYSVIDNRTGVSDAKRLIQGASCVFLMGGNATQQMRLIREKSIFKEICESSAVILGVSAGSSNMAKRALDIWESLVPYEGLGMTGVTVKAHFTRDNQELSNTLLCVSSNESLPICAMSDESAIFIKDNRVTYTGQIHYVNDGHISPLSQDTLEQLAFV